MKHKRHNRTQKVFHKSLLCFKKPITNKTTMKLPFCLVFFLISLTISFAQKVERPPNIIHIFADDLGYGDIACFGATDIKTPNIDRIAKEGIQFTDFYSASSICSPSRAALLTGRLPQRMGMNAVFFAESFTGMPPTEITLAELLKEKNYATGIVGKWHLGHHHRFLPLQQGFDTYFGIPYSNDMESTVYMRGNDVVEYKVDQQYTTKTYTEEAIAYIDQHKEEPFFLYLPHNMPHVPIYASPDFIGTSKRGLYGDVIQEIDWSVGQILQKLEKEGLLENTLVIFSSDNGPWLVMEEHGGSGGGLREGKMYTFDGGMKVPTVAMWKGKIPAGTVSTALATQMDWFPTIANLAGIALPKEVAIDGQDISKVLLNTGTRTDQAFLFLDGAQLQGYRKGDWKVKLPYKGFKGATWKNAVAAHDTLLINLKKDPQEAINLYEDNKSLARQLLAEMHQTYKGLGSLPPSLVVRSGEDNSHYDYLKKKRATATTSANTQQVSFYNRKGALSIGTQSHRTASINLFDIDQDGDLDALVANGRHWPEQNYVHYNTGKGSFKSAQAVGKLLDASYAMKGGDFNGDGNMDLAVANDQVPNKIIWGAKEGIFTKESNFGRLQAPTRNLTIGDIDKDGDLDLLLANRKSTNELVLNDGRGNFKKSIAFGSTDNQTIEIELADMNKDGHVDLIVANRKQMNYIYYNNGQLDFSNSQAYGNPAENTRSIDIVDINKDGFLDIIAGNIGQANVIYYGNADGHYDEQFRFEEENDTYSIRAADINGDGFVDIVTGNAEQLNYVYLGTKGKGFEKVSLGEDAADTYHIELGDLNNDGLLEIVEANSGGLNLIYRMR